MVIILLIFFISTTDTTYIYSLSLHDALPIYDPVRADPAVRAVPLVPPVVVCDEPEAGPRPRGGRADEHTSELQSHGELGCSLLLEKKKGIMIERIMAECTT